MTNKTALVTGASSGIGHAIVKVLSESGWSVIGPSHSELDLNNLSAVTAYAQELKSKASSIDAVRQGIAKTGFHV